MFRKSIHYLQDRLSAEYSDEFTVRLRQVTGSLIRKGNLAGLRHGLSLAPTEGAVVEIGTFTGVSACMIGYFCKIIGRTGSVFTCDKWDYAFKSLGDHPIGKSSVTGRQWGDFVKKTAMENIRFFGASSQLHPIEMWSSDFFGAWRQSLTVSDVYGVDIGLGGPISFAFIDGNHDYRYVKEDFENVDQFLMPGGVILFDDSADFTGSPGVIKFIKEFKSKHVSVGGYEIISKSSNYLIRKRL